MKFGFVSDEMMESVDDNDDDDGRRGMGMLH